MEFWLYFLVVFLGFLNFLVPCIWLQRNWRSIFLISVPIKRQLERPGVELLAHAFPTVEKSPLKSRPGQCLQSLPKKEEKSFCLSVFSADSRSGQIAAVEPHRFENNKIFVGGIKDLGYWDLKGYFSGFGTIVSVRIITNPLSGRSRGFAFITFREARDVVDILKICKHQIKKTLVEAKPATIRREVHKIFVGGIQPWVTEDNIRRYFERFGKVNKVELPVDKFSGRRRHFCFVGFWEGDSVAEACKWPHPNIHGSRCDIRKAVRFFPRTQSPYENTAVVQNNVDPSITQPKVIERIDNRTSQFTTPSPVPVVKPLCGLVLTDSVSQPRAASSLNWDALNEIIDNDVDSIANTPLVDDSVDSDDFCLGGLFESNRVFRKGRPRVNFQNLAAMQRTRMRNGQGI